MSLERWQYNQGPSIMTKDLIVFGDRVVKPRFFRHPHKLWAARPVGERPWGYPAQSRAETALW